MRRHGEVIGMGPLAAPEAARFFVVQMVQQVINATGGYVEIVRPVEKKGGV